MNDIISQLINIADELDRIGYLRQADTVTNIAIKLSQNQKRRVYAQGPEESIDINQILREQQLAQNRPARPQEPPSAEALAGGQPNIAPPAAEQGQATATSPISYNIGLDPATLKAIQDLLLLFLTAGGGAAGLAGLQQGQPQAQQQTAPVGPVPPMQPPTVPGNQQGPQQPPGQQTPPSSQQPPQEQQPENISVRPPTNRNPYVEILNKYGPQALLAALATGALNYILSRRAEYQANKIQEDEMMLIKNIMNKISNLPSAVVRRILLQGTAAVHNYTGNSALPVPPEAPLPPPWQPQQMPPAAPMSPWGITPPERLAPPATQTAPGMPPPPTNATATAAATCKKMLRAAMRIYDYDRYLADNINKTILEVAANESQKILSRNYKTLGNILASEIRTSKSFHHYTKIANIKAKEITRDPFMRELLPYVAAQLPMKSIRQSSTSIKAVSPEIIVRKIIREYGPGGLEPLYRVAKISKKAIAMPEIDITIIADIVNKLFVFVQQYGLSTIREIIDTIKQALSQDLGIMQQARNQRARRMHRQAQWQGILSSIISNMPRVAAAARTIISWVIEHGDKILILLDYIMDRIEQNKKPHEIISEIQETTNTVTAAGQGKQRRFAQLGNINLLNMIPGIQTPGDIIKNLLALVGGGAAGWAGGGALGRHAVSQEAINRERRKQLRDIINREAPLQVRNDPVKLALVTQMAGMDLQQLAMLAAQIDEVAEQYNAYINYMNRQQSQKQTTPGTDTTAKGQTNQQTSGAEPTSSNKVTRQPNIDRSTIERQIKDLQLMYGRYADEAKRLQARINATNDPTEKATLREELRETRSKLNDIHRTAEWLRYQYGDLLR